MILLIEDNETIANNIKQYLELHDFLVHVCYDGTEGMELIQNKYYDLIILDIMLPGVSGTELLQEVRTRKQTPVIMTTALGSIDDKEKGFDLGADDYLVKPFELKELLMRVKSLLKRTTTSDILHYEDLEINLEDKQILKDGEEISLTNKEWLLLSCLFDQEGHPVSRADIVEYIRGGDSLRENDSKLDVYISTLRKKLDKNIIETIKGFGYKIPRFS